MPPKTVTCSVCNESVLKAQTLARTDGTRACRSHEGVVAEAEQRQAAEAAERKKHDLEVVNAELLAKWRYHDAKEQAAFSADWEKQAAEWREHLYSHCWTCGEYGLEGREFFAQAMIAHKRLELRGEFNFLTLGEDTRKLMGNVQLLVPFQSKDETIDRAIVKHVTDKRIRNILPFIRFVLICVPCADRHGFKQRFADMLPKPTWKQLEAMVPVVMGMESLLRTMAEKKEGQS